MSNRDDFNIMAPRRNRGNATAVFFIVFFVVVALISAFIAIDFFESEKRASVNYVIGKEQYKVSGDDAYSSNGVLMVCFDDIAKLCEMTVTGSADKKIFYARESDQKIEISDGESMVISNNQPYAMSAPAAVLDRGVFVPLDFVKEYIEGITVEFKDDTLTVLRSEYNASTKDNPLYVNIDFAGSNDTPATQPTDTVKVAPTYEFSTDLSAFEMYMCPEDVDAFLVLINREKTVTEDYVPENLVPITNVRKDGREEKMVETAEKALQALYIEMRVAGYTDVSVTSGYRTYAKQKYLYGIYTENEMNAHPDWSRARAEQEVDTYSARPGTSEHQSGLCVDMHNLGSASQAFAKKEAYTWLINNCYKFGFILRFPEGKEEITGYSFEPWHYRFVGRYHASEMHRLDMCLEEYIEYLDKTE
ncbi:MAG: D-alanyl-D-alanine carboxypeptidase family protein [Clostridia bacterium]|nr:D-alanyl-D-alanine carboxypeptidase family protein [Clostridia bacterium]